MNISHCPGEAGRAADDLAIFHLHDGKNNDETRWFNFNSNSFTASNFR